MLTFKEFLTEARDPELKYSNKEVKGKIDRVIVSLESHQSGAFTRLAKKYRNIKRATEILQEKQNGLNAQIKDKALELFNAEDEIYTRMVDTVSMTMTISKKTVTTTTKVDYEAILAQLAEMTPELEEKIKELTKAFTSSKSVEKSPSLRTDLKEGVGDWIKQLKFITQAALKSIKNWGKNYDRKLKQLEKMISKLD